MMASIDFTVNFVDGSQLIKSAKVEDADIPRIVGWAMAHYNKPSPQEAIESWIADMIGTALVSVKQHEQTIASHAAMLAVEGIPVVIT